MSARHRVPPFVFAAMFACSLLPTITITALWIRSHFTGDMIDRELNVNTHDFHNNQAWQFIAGDGYLFFTHVHEEWTALRPAPPPTSHPVPVWKYRRVKPDGKRYSGDGPSLLARLGIRWQRVSHDFPDINGWHYFDTNSSVQFEDWTLLILCLIANALCFRLYRKNTLPDRRAKRGLCPTCGYDLRQTPIAARNAAQSHRQKWLDLTHLLG